MVSFFDEIGMYCYWAFATQLTAEYFTQLFSPNYYAGCGILLNLAYNLGFMWTDAINYCFYTPATVPNGDWGFFTVFLIGDFLMRFFFRDENPQLITA